MALREKIPQDLKNALREKRTLELSVLRLLQAALKNKEIEINKKDLSDEDVISVVNSEVKKRRDAVREFENVNRPDAAQNERDEIEILMRYMPEQLSEDEIRRIVRDAKSESDAQSMKDIGQVMKIVMPKVKGKADGAAVNKIVREELEK